MTLFFDLSLKITPREWDFSLVSCKRESIGVNVISWEKGEIMNKIWYLGVIVVLASHKNLFYAMDYYELAGRSFYASRSQSVNAARDLVGYCKFLTYTDCGFQGAFWATPYYEQSFQSARIAEYFFNDSAIRVVGSKVPERGSQDLLADYFGLSPLFSSTVTMDPDDKKCVS